ncbi:MAG: DNA translocase FtsK [Synergistales bacterium]|nr:DNA translocase FtsK [Synergistales bacterium]
MGVRRLLTGTLGGGVVLFLIHSLYYLSSALGGHETGNCLRDFLGTFCLFLAVSVLLGFQDLGLFSLGFAWTEPGIFGSRLSLFLFRHIGPLGTLLAGVTVTMMALLFFQLEYTRRSLAAMYGTLVSLYGAVEGRLRKVGKDTGSPDDQHPGEDRPAAEGDAESWKGEPLEGAFPEEEASPLIRRVRGARPSAEDAEQPVAAVVEHHGREESEDRRDAGSAVPEGESDDVPEGRNGEPLDPLGEDLVDMLLEEGSPATEDALDLPPDIEPGRFPPPTSLLGAFRDNSDTLNEELVRQHGEQIVETLADFGLEAELAETVVGPTVVQFRLQLAPGIKVSKVAGLTNDLAVSLAVPSLRIEAPIPGKPYVGVEIPNPERATVSLREIIECDLFMKTKGVLPLPVGLSVDGRPMVMSLEDMPHLLVAGTTGSGKSVFISSCLIGLTYLRRPSELRLILVDPKRVEMALYENLPHVLCPPIVESKKAVEALAWAVREMERRYALFADARVRHLQAYNEKAIPKDRLPNIVIVVDELADLMMAAPKEVEDYICRLAQKARATGIHLILATQRPSVNVITGLIKANIPARVAFSLPTQADSRTILDVGGAERLLGKGDMLILTSRLPKPARSQSPWIDESAIQAYISYLESLFGAPEYTDITDQTNGAPGQGAQEIDDPLFEEAVQIVLNTGTASASRLQRQLRIGFTRAARLVDAMEDMGIVGSQAGSKARELLMSEEEVQTVLEEHG